MWLAFCKTSKMLYQYCPRLAAWLRAKPKRTRKHDRFLSDKAGGIGETPEPSIPIDRLSTLRILDALGVWGGSL
jgi:hypothetical protein